MEEKELMKEYEKYLDKWFKEVYEPESGILPKCFNRWKEEREELINYNSYINSKIQLRK